MILAGAALIGRILATRSLDARVALATRQLAQRVFYDDLYFDREQLASRIPRARVTDIGTLRAVGGGTGTGRLVVTGDVARLSGLAGSLHGIVVEATAANSDQTADLLRRMPAGVPLLYLTADAADPALAELSDHGGVVWAWDSGRLASLGHNSGGVTRVPRYLAASEETLLRAAHCSVTVTGPADASALDSALAALYRRLARASDDTAANPIAADALRWVWGVATTLVMLPASPAAYDRAAARTWGASPIADAAARAAAHARYVGAAERQLWLDLSHDVAAAVCAAAEANPRVDAAARWVRTVVDAGGRGSVVVKNRAAAAATASTLDEHAEVPYGWEQQVTVVTARNAVTGRTGVEGTLLVCGPLPRAYATLLGAPPAHSLTVLAAGPWETRRAVDQVTGTRRALRDRAVDALRYSAPVLGVDTHRMRLGPTLPPVRVEAGPWSSMPAPAQKPPFDLWDPFTHDVAKLIGTRAVRRGIDTEPPARAETSAATAVATVPAVTLVLQGGVLFCEPNMHLRRRHEGSLTQAVPAKALRRGDVIALVRESARRDLFAVVTERLAELPKYAPLVGLIDYWHERAQHAGHCSDLTHDEILHRMYGTRITTCATIGNWIRGDVTGPAEAADIARFARAVGDSDLAQRADAIGTALNTMRVIHRKVGRSLGALVDDDRLEDREGLLDSEIGLHVTDVLDAVSIHRITDVLPGLVQVPYSRTGMLLARNSARALIDSAGPEPSSPIPSLERL
ncbi:hypothetical protein ABZW18_21235 [Streptomyces sp. NPDC004647]|uniref:DISARM anti-phage system protein DrmE domain-containing protein n=1 Tax=Streptomyces sp. NPDC004647 TaxID=3154671 RepID=UPI0033ACE130